MRITYRLLIATLAVMASVASLRAEDPDAPEAPAPRAPQADQTLITVGANEVRQSQLDAVLSQVPTFKRSAFTEEALSRLTKRLINREFANSNKLPVDEETFQKILAEMQEQFRDQVADVRTRLALNKYVRDRITDEKVKAYIEGHAGFFDGTTVEVSRILIKCSIHDSSADQLAARQKLSRIVKDIEDRKIPFDAAAATYSDCPSRAKNGRLGKLEFGGEAKEMMLKIASFMTGEGQVSPIIRTPDGWEVVLVTKVERGDGKPKPWKNPIDGKKLTPEALARRAIIAMIENQILRSAVGDCQVVNLTKTAKPAEAAATATPAAPAR